MEQLADFLANRCGVTIRFARFIIYADDTDEFCSLQTMVDKTNFIRNAVRIATLGGIFPNEIQCEALAINNNVSVFVAKIVLMTEQHAISPLSRTERCTLLQKIMNRLNQDIVHLLP